jgi:hypothetical protein
LAISPVFSIISNGRLYCIAIGRRRIENMLFYNRPSEWWWKMFGLLYKEGKSRRIMSKEKMCLF